MAHMNGAAGGDTELPGKASSADDASEAGEASASAPTAAAAVAPQTGMVDLQTMMSTVQ